MSSKKIEQKIGDVKINGSADATADAMYLQLPLHFAYKINLAPDTRLVLHAGPYAAYGVGGKTTTKSSVKVLGNVPANQKAAVDEAVKKLNTKSEVNTFDKKAGYKPFDAGVGAGVGAEFGSFFVDLGWDMGLLNIARTKDSSLKTQNAYLSIGYKF